MATLLEFKCPCCGGAIAFDSSLQKMKCPYCDNEFDIDTLKSLDEKLDSSAEPEWETQTGCGWNDNDGVCSYVCNSCGGEIICDENTAAACCPYCDSPVVMKGKLSGDLKPDYIIPFRLDKNAAKAGLKNYFKGKRLLPKVFGDENHIDEIKGVYVPFWLFDAEISADMRYRATRVSVWSDSKYDYTKTSFYSVRRGGNVSFEHVPVDGSQKMPDDIMEAIEPFDFSAAVDFKTAYLAGYLADKYDVSDKESVGRANERIRSTTEHTFSETVVGYASVVPDGANISFSNTDTKYALLPVWLLNTTWRGKKYVFAMNGQTGKLTGDLPVDKKAYVRWLFGLAAAVSAAAFAVMSLVWRLL